MGSLRIFLILPVVFCHSVSLRAGTWESVGPYGGYIRGLAAGPGNTVYAATEFGGVFRTLDEGLSWEQIFDFSLVGQPVSSRTLAVDETGELLAGTDGFGLLHFDGVSWRRLFTTIYNRGVTSLLPLAGTNLYPGTFDGLYKSTDNGATFTLVTAVPSSTILALHETAAGVLFAASFFNGFYRSEDNGVTSVDILGNLPEPITAVTSSPATGRLYMTAGSKVFTSTDLGGTWTDLNAPLAGYSGRRVRGIDGGTDRGGRYMVRSADHDRRDERRRDPQGSASCDRCRYSGIGHA